jgi:hypothetical protein
MIDPTLTTVAAVLLAAYAVLAAVDGLYIHLWRLRLHQRAETRREHWLHTLRALLFPAFVGGLFAAPTAGTLLWAAVGVAVLDLVIGLWDVAIERDSRATLGGLGTAEYTVHVTLTMLHAASLALILAARPASAWTLDGPTVLHTPMPGFSAALAINLVPGAIVLGLLHVYLGLRGARSAGARVAA